MINLNLKNRIVTFVLKGIHKSGRGKAYMPAVGQIFLGDLDRETPFSKEFGFDRGGAIDRYYIENFLQKESRSIKGRVLEIGDDYYINLYGGNRVTKRDVLHVNADNRAATIIGDISHAPQIPSDIFDCIILTQTLHLIYNFEDAIKTCHRILKPGGVLLLTVPGITPIDHDEWNSTWYWSFTDKALHRLMENTFPEGEIGIQSFGNVNVASAFLYGMGINEVSKKKLDYYDPHFQVINTLKAVKRK